MTSGTQTARLVAGRYELSRRLGAGGMAEVFLARDQRTGADVAVKLLSPALADDPKLVARFAAEARAAAAIDHPNVVAVRDYGDDFIVMEYVAGPNLKELMRERGPLPEPEALAIAGQIAAGLEAAHARGVVHLDVKPHNVLLSPDGPAKVADFGIAQALGGTDATLTTVIGSAPYLSPEQARGARVDARSDIYSLGALLYELLTGRPPFEGDAPLQVALRHLNEPPVPPRQLRPELSAGAEAIVLRALAKEPGGRFGSAAEMGRAIEAVGLGGLASTQPLLALDATQRLPAASPLAAAATSAASASVRASPPSRPAAPAPSPMWPALGLLALLGAVIVAFAAFRPPSASLARQPTATVATVTKPTVTASPSFTATTPPQTTATSRPPPTATRVQPTIVPLQPKVAVVKPGREDDERKPKKPRRDDDDDD